MSWVPVDYNWECMEKDRQMENCFVFKSIRFIIIFAYLFLLFFLSYMLISEFENGRSGGIQEENRHENRETPFHTLASEQEKAEDDKSFIFDRA